MNGCFACLGAPNAQNGPKKQNSSRFVEQFSFSFRFGRHVRRCMDVQDTQAFGGRFYFFVIHIGMVRLWKLWALPYCRRALVLC